MPTSTLRTPPRPALRRLPLALASACLLSAALPGLADNRAPTATALPGGLNVVRGQASVQTQGQQMTVTNSAGAILNWQQFSIGSGAAVYFQQPSSVSQVLNRVVGRDPSQILGQLGSNGKVWLLNPQGVLFGRDARIDVAGLVASTLNIRDDDWLAGRYRLTQGDTAGTLVNQGALQADEGGRIVLVGGSAGVRNEGLIEAPGGQVLLAAGQSVELVDTHLPHLAVRLDAPAGTALNLGRIAAAGGHVDLMAALVNQDGIVRADALGEGPGGRIVLDAQDRLTLGTGSTTSAGSTGGTGGGLTLSGRQIALLDGALVDASGATGGGHITVGGGMQGRDPSLRHAEAVWMAPTASLQADATLQGDGGSIVLWSDHATRVYGALSARGGALGGNGGFIETSGGWLDARPAQVRTGAARGRAGLWLLDPWDITISDTGGDSNIGGGPDFTAIGSSATILTSTIEAALEAGNNVSITTASTGFEAGDIRMLNATVDVAPSSPVLLTLRADRNIVLDGATIRSQGAPLSLQLQAGSVGAIAIHASNITTAGGDLLLGGRAPFIFCNTCEAALIAAQATDSTGYTDGIAILGSVLDAGAGRIDAYGTSTVTVSSTSGILIGDGSTVRGRDISLLGRVDSSGSLDRTGVKVTVGGLVAATNSLNIDGQAYSSFYSYDGSPTGVEILGEVRLDGSGGTGEGESLLGIYGYSEDASPGYGGYGGYGGLFGEPRAGVGIRGSTGRVVATNGASISITGTATDSGSGADLGVQVDSTAVGAIDTSQGGDLSLYSSGNLLISADLRVSEQGGRLSLQADGSLFILGATVTGDPTSVDIVAGSGLQIGSSSQPARLVFGDSTSVHIQAPGFLFGADSFFIPDQGGVFAEQAQDGRVRPLAVLADTPGSTTLLAAGGPITVFTDALSIGPDATFYSPASGLAVTLAGTANNLHAISLFDNQAGASAISTPNGHWEVWAQAPESEGLFFPGSLVPDFRQVDAVYGQTQPALSGGRGFFFQGSAQLTLFLGEGAPPITKVYDGNTSVDAEFYGLFVSGFRGQDTIDGALGYDDKNVGSSKNIALNAVGLTGIQGPDGAPVFGYTLDFSAGVGVAAITPATLDLRGAQINDKVYDGTVQAVVQQWDLNGFVAGDDLMVIGDATFGDKNAGSAKPVSLSVFALSGIDAGNYVLGNVTTGSATGNVLPAPLNLVTGLVADKVYDRGTSATVSNASVSGAVEGDMLSFALSGSFDDKNAGVGKSASVTLTGFSGADAGNYTLGSTLSVATSATITPATVNVDGATVANKTYDGTVNTSVTSLALSGVIAGDTVTGSADARFADRNAGSAKPVTVSLLGLSGADAGNYTLGGTLTATTTAAITPAMLTYVATPATVAADAPLTGFTGVVTGFVGGDTLASATTGTAVFSPALEGVPVPGVYALNGSGLTAANYSLTQAAGNATALTIVAASAPPPPPPPPPPVSGEQAAAVVTPTERIAGVKPPRDLLPAPLATAPEIGRLLDLMPALDPTNRDAIFGALDLSALGPDRVAAVLAARDGYKKALFSPALARLEQDPTLADAPGCATAQQAASGQCLMVTPLDRESVISNARVVERLPVASPPAVQPAPPAPAAAAPGTPAAPAAPVAPATVAAPRPPVPVVVPPFPERRSVRQATLPQIQRKIAVVVGIDEYADARIPRLANSVRDARAVAQKLESSLGYETVVLENPTKAALFRVLNRLTAESSPQDSVVLYYAGHGELVPQTGLGYWQPSDADATRPETWVSNSDINRVLRGIGASQVALVSDSCFSGSLVGETRIRGVSPTQDPAALLARRAAVVMSSGGNEPVADSGRNGHSPFAFSLMQALERVPAWRPGSNLFEQVRFQVARQLPQRPQYGASGQGGHEPGADYVFEQRQLEGVTR